LAIITTAERSGFNSGAAATTSSPGANHAGLRAHNERLVLSLLRRHGALSKAEVSRRTNLSAQTISVIIRLLEEDNLVRRGAPVKGKVGQPSVPMTLDPDGAFTIGLRLGRRSSDLALMDFQGAIRRKIKVTYAYPTPDLILDFVSSKLPELKDELSPNLLDRVIGMGLGAPFQIYNWLDSLGAPQAEMNAWRDFDLRGEIEQLTGMEVFQVNDASCGCVAEQAMGAGLEMENFAYFYVGSFIGGGLVMDGAVQTGSTGNAAAFGPIPSPTAQNQNAHLIDTASLHPLERALIERGVEPSEMWLESTDWSDFEPELSHWMDATAPAIARAIVTVCAVVDFPHVVIDGAFPPAVRKRLVEAINLAMEHTNTDGVIVPTIVEGAVGPDARIVGAALLPVFARYGSER
jgi:predicted NBD/HSP70 family sugar kinase